MPEFVGTAKQIFEIDKEGNIGLGKTSDAAVSLPQLEFVMPNEIAAEPILIGQRLARKFIPRLDRASIY